MVTMLRARLGVDIPVSAVFQDPTPGGLARRIGSPLNSRGASAGWAFGVVLPLRSTGALPPLFCVHPGSGLSWAYSGLLQHLSSDRPVYGLQSPVISGEPAFESVQQLAHRYVEEIRTIQPKGPYHLLGWSLGGVIAHVMAIELRSAGAEVATLAIMDSPLVEGDDPFPRRRRSVRGRNHRGKARPRDGRRVRQHPRRRRTARLRHGTRWHTARERNVLRGCRCGPEPVVRRGHRAHAHAPETPRRLGREPETVAARLSPWSLRGGPAVLQRGEVVDDAGERKSAEIWRPAITGAIREHVVDCAHSRWRRRRRAPSSVPFWTATSPSAHRRRRPTCLDCRRPAQPRCSSVNHPSSTSWSAATDRKIICLTRSSIWPPTTGTFTATCPRTSNRVRRDSIARSRDRLSMRNGTPPVAPPVIRPREVSPSSRPHSFTHSETSGRRSTPRTMAGRSARSVDRSP